MVMTAALPEGITVFERGWLSANNVLFHGDGETALVDSGYCTHAEQTLELVGRSLKGRPLDQLINTHLHSDHCGGNAELQFHYPLMETRIPPGLEQQVRNWDPVALTYSPTGQQCPRFNISSVIEPGKEIALGNSSWQIHGSPGHDPHSVILFEPRSRALISGDSLWENGFGVIFQELEGERAFYEVAGTLDLIESLDPAVVIPGHGKVFTHVSQSLAAARRRLEIFMHDPLKHASRAVKVLLKFKLLELQRSQLRELTHWAAATPYFNLVHARFFCDVEMSTWITQLAADLVRS